MTDLIDLCKSILLAPYQPVPLVHRKCWLCNGEGRIYAGSDPERDAGELCRACNGKKSILEEYHD